MEVKIVQISATVTGAGPHAGMAIFGLGEDNKIYLWRGGAWQLFQS